jgi:hypothetical protein
MTSFLLKHSNNISGLAMAAVLNISSARKLNVSDLKVKKANKNWDKSII